MPWTPPYPFPVFPCIFLYLLPVLPTKYRESTRVAKQNSTYMNIRYIRVLHFRVPLVLGTLEHYYHSNSSGLFSASQLYCGPQRVISEFARHDCSVVPALNDHTRGFPITLACVTQRRSNGSRRATWVLRVRTAQEHISFNTLTVTITSETEDW